ncbi:MAG: hypothetical protein OEV72_13920, partial [Thermoleophilia bacterium]|nr:hypothetical protein [Thermoleophilia bacterium]
MRDSGRSRPDHGSEPGSHPAPSQRCRKEEPYSTPIELAQEALDQEAELQEALDQEALDQEAELQEALDQEAELQEALDQ